MAIGAEDYGTTSSGQDVKVTRVVGDIADVWWVEPQGRIVEDAVPLTSLTLTESPSWSDPADL